MKKTFTRLVALVLAVSLSLSTFVIPSFAVDSIAFTLAVSEFLDRLDIVGDVAKSVHDACNFRFSNYDSVSARVLDIQVQNYNHDPWLYNALASSSTATEKLRAAYRSAYDSGIAPGDLQIKVKQDPAQNNIYRPYFVGFNQCWMVDVDGHYPYCSKEEWEAYKGISGDEPGGNVPAQDPIWNPYRNKWVPSEEVNFASGAIATKDALASALLELGRGELWAVQLGRGKYYLLYDKINDEYWCNNNKQCWMAPVNDDNVIINSKLDYIIDKLPDPEPTPTPEPTATPGPTPTPAPGGNDTDIWNGSLIDLSNSKFSLVDELGSLLELNIDNVTFDFATKNYTVNCFDIDYNYYTYNVQYTYNNTYVSYIGSTAEFQPKEYELYYQLPDGRSSADLTEEDVAGLSFQFADVLNYKRAVTDTSLLALYHFDGDTDDDSFYNTSSPFKWNKGASITYMESNNFNGALYLDEKEHQFTISLPKSLGTDNFTLQFRYYQNSATTSENVDNYISSNGVNLFGWSEQHMYSYPQSDTGFGRKQITTGLSVGTWQEIALMRVGRSLRIYHNGIRVTDESLYASLGSSITFTLGSASKAYGMLDELRVLDFAYVSNWGNYTPTVVPYDTNEVLVLPDSPVDTGLVDGHIEFNYVTEPVVKFDALNTDYDDCWDEFLHYFTQKTTNNYTKEQVFLNTSGDGWEAEIFPRPNWNNAHFCFASDDSGMSFDYKNGVVSPALTTSSMGLLVGDYFVTSPGSAPVIPLGVKHKSSSGFGQCGSFLSGDYIFMIFFDDGSCAKQVINFSSNWSESYKKTYLVSSGTRSIYLDVCQYHTTIDGTYSLQYLCLYGGYSYRYFELKEGRFYNPHQWVYDVPDTNDGEGFQPNTAAIRSNIPVKGYTVGGVRPTFPKRGDVWFSVDGRRISGVQIYNGRAWEAVEARWWTGSRWIPIYAFDIVTLADMWDVSGSDGTTTTPPITSETGFWNWWKNQWLDFRQQIATEWTSFREWLKEALKNFGVTLNINPPGGKDPVTVTKTYEIDFLTVPPSPYVNNFVCGTENYFTANGNRIRHHEEYLLFPDGFKGYGYYTFGGVTKPDMLEQRSIKFTTTTANAKVKVWWWRDQSKAGPVRAVNLLDSASVNIVPSEVVWNTSGLTKSFCVETWSVEAAGMYYITVMGGDCHVYKVEVTETFTESSGGVSADKDETGWSPLDILKAIKDAIWNVIKGIVGAAFGGVAGIIGNNLGEFFDQYKNSDSGDLDSIFGIANYGGADIWD